MLILIFTLIRDYFQLDSGCHSEPFVEVESIYIVSVRVLEVTEFRIHLGLRQRRVLLEDSDAHRHGHQQEAGHEGQFENLFTLRVLWPQTHPFKEIVRQGWAKQDWHWDYHSSQSSLTNGFSASSDRLSIGFSAVFVLDLDSLFELLAPHDSEVGCSWEGSSKKIQESVEEDQFRARVPGQLGGEDPPGEHSDGDRGNNGSSVAFSKVSCGVGGRSISVAVVHSTIVGLVKPLQESIEHRGLRLHEEHATDEGNVEECEAVQPHHAGNNLSGIRMD